ncbi:DUF4142 domain-containing protein [Paraburkholderia strydomiana]|uniref:DUF4142 domain-containing protein n=1 Tax=Paraburkholderia strydomiana TaxID=1245417 RepID=UPI001BEBCF37|nr:DUF4142 domain-containing protein [Paraburkholderia strydomiana]MBT2792948.1 DUF4142 domain-containing protein [Paraburkholderia strydomiana]
MNGIGSNGGALVGRHGRPDHAPRSRLFAALCFSAALATTGCRLLQSGAEVSPTDQQFMLTAASVGTAEVDLGQLAATRGSSPEVRAFGEHMVIEHTRINAELTRLAEAKHVRLLKAMDPANHTLYSELSHLSGPRFDREYAISQLHIHRMGNSLYASEAAQGEDADVKAFAARGVLVGQDHLQHAVELAKALPVAPGK